MLRSDPRVADVVVHGSIGRGEADAYSDLDITVFTVPEHQAEFVGDWPAWLAQITPTVFARTPIAPFVLNTVTAEGLTLDLLIVPAGTPPYARPAGFAVGMLSGARYTEPAAALDYAVAECLRGLAGPFRSFLERGEHVTHMTGCAHILGLLTTVMLIETGSDPATVKRVSAALNDEQRTALEALPALRPTRDDIAAFGLAVAGETLRRARPLFVTYELEWPAALEVVARRRVTEMGFVFSDA